MNSLGITSLSFRQALNYTIACGLLQNHYINTWVSQYYQSLSNECNISDCPAMWVHWLKKIDVVTPCWTYFVVIFLKPHTSCVICVDTYVTDRLNYKNNSFYCLDYSHRKYSYVSQGNLITTYNFFVIYVDYKYSSILGKYNVATHWLFRKLDFVAWFSNKKKRNSKKIYNG